MTSCNICGGEVFSTGPGGRLSHNGKKPSCDGCFSLERHRIFRRVFERLYDEDFKNCTALQFSNDNTITPGSLKSLEVSIYDGDNSLDLQAINKADNSFDIVVCNHVIEHVQDDRAALRELDRIAAPEGFIFLSFPLPLRFAHTLDWGHPDPKMHGHYRVYGMDVVTLLRAQLGDRYIVMFCDSDPVTTTSDAVFLITSSRKRFQRLAGKLDNHLLINAPELSSLYQAL